MEDKKIEVVKKEETEKAVKRTPEKALKKEGWKFIALEKPVEYMGMKVEALDLTGLDDLTLDDMIEVYNLYDAMGGQGTVMQESSLLFAKLTAQRLTGVPLEALGKIGAKDAIKLKNRIYRFFYMSV